MTLVSPFVILYGLIFALIVHDLVKDGYHATAAGIAFGGLYGAIWLAASWLDWRRSKMP